MTPATRYTTTPCEHCRTAGATSSPSALMTPAETSGQLLVPDSTLRFWRHTGVGPEWIKVGRLVRYERASVEAWLADQRRSSTRAS